MRFVRFYGIKKFGASNTVPVADRRRHLRGCTCNTSATVFTHTCRECGEYNTQLGNNPAVHWRLEAPGNCSFRDCRTGNAGELAVTHPHLAFGQFCLSAFVLFLICIFARAASTMPSSKCALLFYAIRKMFTPSPAIGLYTQSGNIALHGSGHLFFESVAHMMAGVSTLGHCYAGIG